MTNQNRQPKGKPTGGRFTTCPTCEQPVGLPLAEPSTRTEPDDRDYAWAAEACLIESGLGSLEADRYDSGYRHIGFKGSIRVSEIDADELPEGLARKLQSIISDQGADRKIEFHSYGDDEWVTPPQLWSTPLDEAERGAALAALDAADIPFGDGMLSYWEAGNSSDLDEQYGLAQTTRVWKQIGTTVAAASPTARQRLELAEALAANVRKEWNDQCDYLGSIEWVEDQAES